MDEAMRIETERLALVPVSEAHAKEMFTHFNQEVTAYMVPCPVQEFNEMLEVVRRFVKQRKRRTDDVFAVTRKESGEFLGIVGLHHLKDEIPELGVWIKTEAHGNHYGREAVGGVIRYAADLGIQKLMYPVDRRNIPSKKIPLFYHGELTGGYQTVKTPDGRILEEEIYLIET